MKKVLLSAIFLMASVSAMAQSTNSVSNGATGGKGPGKNPAVEAAIKECASSVSKDSNGRPDHSAMEACMTAKGFTPPPHGPHGPRGGEQGGSSQVNSNSTGTASSESLK